MLAAASIPLSCWLQTKMRSKLLMFHTPRYFFIFKCIALPKMMLPRVTSHEEKSQTLGSEAITGFPESPILITYLNALMQSA